MCVEELTNTAATLQKEDSMDKGIRAFARTYFAAQNALRVAGEVYSGPKANTAFRKAVMVELMTQFGVTLASAATHYNEALISMRKATPEAVQGLGRPDDKKGGRKKKEDAPAAQPDAVEVNTSDAATSLVLPNVLMLDAPAANDAAPAEQELAVA
jgi:hypothetical protein